MSRLVFVTGLVCVAAGAAFAGEIEAACLKSERARGQVALCGCIQDAADMTLTKKDQKLAASFFLDPHRAQEVRQSDSRNHEAFWERYENFGVAAETFCRP